MTDSTHSLKQLFNQVSQGDLSVDEAMGKLNGFSYQSIEDFARIDQDRAARTGFPEAIWGPGKTPEQLVKIFEVMRDRQPFAIATRIEPEVYQLIHAQLPELRYFKQSKLCALSDPPEQPFRDGRIGILTGGTSDIPVAEEAALVARYWGFEVTSFWDVGVAGLHRLLSNLDAIAQSDVLIVAAGMEGALASVVAGLVDRPVIAVPTSVGYGASFNGLAPLLTMLNSCAPGIGVVNIDNGFGAAMLAGQILRTGHRLNHRDS